jgi:hypothetical protein
MFGVSVEADARVLEVRRPARPTQRDRDRARMVIDEMTASPVSTQSVMSRMNPCAAIVQAMLGTNTDTVGRSAVVHTREAGGRQALIEAAEPEIEDANVGAALHGVAPAKAEVRSGCCSEGLGSTAGAAAHCRSQPPSASTAAGSARGSPIRR